jgi:hypothetical protein
MLSLSVSSASAQTWQDERYHLSMQSPEGWLAMSDELLAQTNAQVSHVTGRGFIAGYMLRDMAALVFPYMLVQYKPYTALPEGFRPQAKLDEQGQLNLLVGLVGAFRQNVPLPGDIDTPQFIDRFGNDHARLTRLEDDGRFDFAGKIPHEIGQDPIRYHTHGVIGKDGVGLVTVFTIDDYAVLAPLINNEMRTLAFENGFGMAALPDEPPRPEPVDDASDRTAPIDTPVEADATSPVASDGDTVAPSVSTNDTTAATDEATSDAESSQETADLSDAPARDASDAGPLYIILGGLAVVLIVTVAIVWFVTHQKELARRERARARRERLERLERQASAQVDRSPRPASPTSAATPRSRDSTGRRKPGTTRS